MEGNPVLPITDREHPPVSLVSVTASQAAITDNSLQPIIAPYPLPVEANNMELRFFAKHGANDPENQTSEFEVYAWPKRKRVNIVTGAVDAFYPTEILADFTVVWSDADMTLNPVTQATENWAEADAFTLTLYRNVIEVGNTVNDRGKRLDIDLTGLGYVLVVCNDIDSAGTINEVRVLGRPF